VRKAFGELRKKYLQRIIGSLSVKRRRILAWESMAKTGVESIRFNRGGLNWTVPLSAKDPIAWSLFVTGGFQTEDIDAVLCWAQHFRVFSESRNVLIDAGANLGTTCIPIVHAAGCRALAIEPVAATFSMLHQNVELNSFRDTILLANKAVAVKPGRLRMCLAETPGWHFVSSTEKIPPQVSPITGYEDVEADTLSGIIVAAGLHADEIALVWSDVQGCELAVIESARELWARGVPLWAEVEPVSLKIQGTLDIFADRVAADFDRFIEASELRRLGAAAVPRPICEFAQLIAGITPEQVSTDVMLLPPAFTGHPN
jgi:FkbM family methyltransferase